MYSNRGFIGLCTSVILLNQQAPQPVPAWIFFIAIAVFFVLSILEARR